MNLTQFISVIPLKELFNEVSTVCSELVSHYSTFISGVNAYSQPIYSGLTLFRKHRILAITAPAIMTVLHFSIQVQFHAHELLFVDNGGLLQFRPGSRPGSAKAGT